MEKIINTTFDFFAYALPGAFMVLSCLLLDDSRQSCADFIDFAREINLGSGILLLALGYVTGFAVTPLGRKLYKAFYRRRLFRKLDVFLEGKLAKKNYAFDDGDLPEQKLTVSERFVLVRQLSPGNFQHIESWHVYSLMSHNLALACLLAVLFIFVRIVFQQPDTLWPWLVLMAAAVLLALLFLYNAIKFNIWSANELNAAVDKLRLPERAGKPTDRADDKPLRS